MRLNSSNPNDPASSVSPDEYWAATPDELELASEMVCKIEDYDNFCTMSGKLSLWRRSYEFYHRSAVRAGRINKAGNSGELSLININQYRNLLRHLLVMTMEQRPAFNTMATNSDTKSLEQAILGNCLLDYYLREKRLERFLRKAVEYALVFDEGFVYVSWDATSGEEYGVNPETGAKIFAGDIKYSTFYPGDVIRDFSRNTPEDPPWYILRGWANKYDLIADYPEMKEKILAVPCGDNARRTRISQLMNTESDEIPMYTLMHKASPSLPNGRLTVILSSDVVLFDGPLPYRGIPVYRVSGGEQLGTSFGYTVGYDLLPIQEMLDNLYSVAATNQNSFGVSNVAVPKGAGINVSSLGGGLNFIEYDPKFPEPKALNLTNTPPEIFQFMQILESIGETISGVSSVTRGNPEASLKSGAALALVQSMSIQFSADLQLSYTQLVEDCGTGTINLLRDFAKVPRIAAIVGKNNRSYLKSFTGDDLSEVQRVTVDQANPLTRTLAGKVNLAQDLMQNGLVESADQYITLLTTGRFEPVIEGKQKEQMLIREENEELAAGNKVQAIVTDKHMLHILEHASVTASVSARKDPRILEATLTHIQEHIEMMQNPQVAQLMAILHQEPLPAGAPQAGQMLDATPPTLQAAGAVNGPSLPGPPEGADANTAMMIEQQRNAG